MGVWLRRVQPAPECRWTNCRWRPVQSADWSSLRYNDAVESLMCRAHRRRLAGPATATLACLLIASCGGGVSNASQGARGRTPTTGARGRTPTTGARATHAPQGRSGGGGGRASNASRRASGTAARAGGAALRVWPEFGLDPARSDATNASTGITTSSIRHLRRIRVELPGTVDSSPVYLHGASVRGRKTNVAIVTTTYGRTIAIDADSGALLWTFTPRGYSRWAGSAQITTASPLIGRSGRYVYAASPNGFVHKLSIATGAEVEGGRWPVRVTLNPSHEKITPALNLDGAYLLVATGGYYGDAPPYQGHVVAIERDSGRIRAVFNTLCANRRRLIDPSSCSASDSAILSRSGPVVEPGGRKVLVATGNGPWNGRTDFGDSVIELRMPSLTLRQAYTPVDQERLNKDDLDLGSGSPALLGHGRVLIGGKDGVLRVLSLAALDGHAPRARGARRERLGGEVQQLPLPGGGQLFTTPAVWRHGSHTTVFLADEHATAAFALRHGRLTRLWQNATPGTSPVLAGGLLYVYEPDRGGIEVYDPASPKPIAKLPGSPGHWNSPIVVDGHVLEPEGDGNEHALSGTLDIFLTG